MGINEINGVKYISFDLLDNLDFVNCKISTKIGGVSKNIYESMNLSFSIGDFEENVYENYEIFSNTLGFTYDNIQRGYQTHSTNVNVVTNENFMPFSSKPQFEDTDILMTNRKHTPLATLFADCVPLFLVDKKTKAIAVVHAGWRGTLNNAPRAAVTRMNETYGTEIDDLIVCIGPSIHNCCFLVDDDVFSEFNKIEEYRQFITKVVNKYSIDLQQINKYNLLQTGLVKEENIEISELCTCCNTHIFHSHRKQKLERGSMAGLLEIIK